MTCVIVPLLLRLCVIVCCECWEQKLTYSSHIIIGRERGSLSRSRKKKETRRKKGAYRWCLRWTHLSNRLSLSLSSHPLFLSVGSVYTYRFGLVGCVYVLCWDWSLLSSQPIDPALLVERAKEKGTCINCFFFPSFPPSLRTFFSLSSFNWRMIAQLKSSSRAINSRASILFFCRLSFRVVCFLSLRLFPFHTIKIALGAFSFLPAVNFSRECTAGSSYTSAGAAPAVDIYR